MVDSCGVLIDFQNVFDDLSVAEIPWNDRLVILIELRDINAKLQRVLGGHKGRWGLVEVVDTKLIFGFEK